MVMMLLKHQADPQIRNHEGKKPHQIAATAEIKQLLLQTKKNRELNLSEDKEPDYVDGVTIVNSKKL